MKVWKTPSRNQARNSPRAKRLNRLWLQMACRKQAMPRIKTATAATSVDAAAAVADAAMAEATAVIEAQIGAPIALPNEVQNEPQIAARREPPSAPPSRVSRVPLSPRPFAHPIPAAASPPVHPPATS